MLELAIFLYGKKGEILETLKIKKPVSYMKFLRLVSNGLILFVGAVVSFALVMINFESSMLGSWMYAFTFLGIAGWLFVQTLIKYSAGYFNETAKREAFKDSAIMAVEDWLIKSEIKIQYPLKLRADDVKSGDKAKDKKIKFLNKSYVAWKTLKVRVHTSDNSQKWDVVLDQTGNIKVKVID